MSLFKISTIIFIEFGLAVEKFRETAVSSYRGGPNAVKKKRVQKRKGEVPTTPYKNYVKFHRNRFVRLVMENMERL